MKFTLLFFLLFSTFSTFSQNSLKFVNPGSVIIPKGYSQTAQIDMGNSIMLLISGQVPLDVQGNLVGRDNFTKQTEQVFTNIKNIIEEAGGNINHLAKITIFIKDISKIQVVREVRDQFVNSKAPPASTLVEVSKLYREDVMIEIEATAVIPKR
ncbi:RidA family protein [Emticicia sp. BO119]|uniref:RidA family protein n=1 Tax=Emticicia sp. BO119 TaxID=2757768 RepID=UPI0015F099D8|nr:RidA family protein [Emticicia sp. BO119]MBA4852476.1 RidA family protein [Emticicia sp. BO119]